MSMALARCITHRSRRTRSFSRASYPGESSEYEIPEADSAEASRGVQVLLLRLAGKWDWLRERRTRRSEFRESRPVPSFDIRDYRHACRSDPSVRESHRLH